MSEIEKFNFVLHLVMSKQITGWNNTNLTGKVGYIFPLIENHRDPEISATHIPIKAGSGIFYAEKAEK